MRHSRHAILAVGFLVAWVAPLQADDKEAQAIIAKAIKAQGGAEALAKFPASVTKFKGKLHVMGAALEMIGEVSSQGADKYKMEFSLEETGGPTFRNVFVLDGDKGWYRFGVDGGPPPKGGPLPKDKLAEMQEGRYAAWVADLTPLTGKGFTLATPGEVRVHEKTALGVKVSAKGHRDVTLHFDKETGMLVKTESRVKDEATGQDVTAESLLSDYKEVQGTKQAMKFMEKRDGKLFMEYEVTDYKLVDKLGADVFAKP